MTKGVEHRQKFCILAFILENEFNFALEWILYHQTIGADHLFIYSQSSSKLNDLLKSQLDYVTIVSGVAYNDKIDLTTKQNSACLDFLKNHQKEYDWYIPLSISHFIYLKGFLTIQEIIELPSKQKKTEIALNEKVFGHHGKFKKTNRLVIDNFTRRSSKINFGAHKIFRCNTNKLIFESNALYFETNKSVSAGSLGQINSNHTEIATSTACIHFYPCRSFEHYLLENPSGEKNFVEWIAKDKNEIDDQSLKSKSFLIRKKIRDVKKLKLITLSNNTSDNPFSLLLNHSLAIAGYELSGLHSTLSRSLRPVFGSELLIQVQWLHRHLNQKSYLTLIKSAVIFIFEMILNKLKGVRICWIMHNNTPHGSIYPKTTFLIYRVFAQLSDAIVVMSYWQKNEAIKLYQIKQNKINVIPHGNYLTAYENNISQEQAKINLGVSGKKVYLFFGRIETYKGIINFIDEFANKRQQDEVLIIAGNTSSQQIKSKLCKREGVIIHADYIDDNAIQYYFNAADISIFPFEQITNSGSVILAMTFGKPIICPNIGSLSEIVKSDFGILYEPGKIWDAIEYSRKLNLVKMGKAAKTAALQKDWNKIASLYGNIYDNLLHFSKRRKKWINLQKQIRTFVKLINIKLLFFLELVEKTKNERSAPLEVTEHHPLDSRLIINQLQDHNKTQSNINVLTKKTKVALIAVIQDEVSFIDEWISYHRILGVDHFYLYNYSKEPRLESMLKNHQNFISIIPWKLNLNAKDFSVQKLTISAYNHFLEYFSKNFDWMITIDSNEFINLKKNTSIKDFISNYDLPEIASISLNQAVFSHNGFYYNPDSVLQNLTRRRKKIGTDVKSITRISSVNIFNSPHFADLILGTRVNVKGNKIERDLIENEVLKNTDIDEIEKIAYLNYYRCRSFMDWMSSPTRNNSSNHIIDSPSNFWKFSKEGYLEKFVREVAFLDSEVTDKSLVPFARIINKQ